MTDYEPGSVVIHSVNCSHAFHQNCLLDWCSRENYDCPVCRTTFWDPEKSMGKNEEKKMSAAAANNSRSGNGEEADGVVFGMVRRRSRSDTVNIDTLSEYVREYCFGSRG